MADARTIMLERQRDAFRLAEAAGVSRKQIAYHSGYSVEAIKTWALGQACMPFAAIDGLLGCFPAPALDLLLPDGHALVRLPETSDHAAVANWAMGIVGLYTAARDPASEAGTAIGAGEAEALNRAAAGGPVAVVK